MCPQPWECLQQWGKCLQQLGKVCNSGGNVCDSGGNVCDSGGNVCNSGEIEYGLGNLRVEIVINNFDRLPIKVHGITCKNPIRI